MDRVRKFANLALFGCITYSRYMKHYNYGKVESKKDFDKERQRILTKHISATFFYKKNIKPASILETLTLIQFH